MWLVPSCENVIRAILQSPSGNDTVVFSVPQCQRIVEARQYPGVRVRVVGRIGNTRTPFHIDVAVGDVIVPKPIDREIPTQLEGFETPTVEKLDCIIARMELNSRMKDFYDIFYIAANYRLDGRTLQEAMYQTLQRRGTAYERDTMEEIKGLGTSPTMQTRWTVYARDTLGLDLKLGDILDLIHRFLSPAFGAIVDEHELSGEWDPSERRYI